MQLTNEDEHGNECSVIIKLADYRGLEDDSEKLESLAQEFYGSVMNTLNTKKNKEYMVKFLPSSKYLQGYHPELLREQFLNAIKCFK